MARDNKTDPNSEKQAGYAFWESPGSDVRVVYSLDVLRRIDFAVNEGFRKISHGGIEEGGLLLGKIAVNAIHLEAFRPIECEHAFGPSFRLSDNDVTKLEEQIAGCETDPELDGLRLIGWFVAHTRSPLRMTDREAGIFDRFFPQSGQLTMIAKPERFQPTKFGFLVRGANGMAARDAAPGAMILPLSVKTARPGSGPVPSIPATQDAEPENAIVEPAIPVPTAQAPISAAPPAISATPPAQGTPVSAAPPAAATAQPEASTGFTLPGRKENDQPRPPAPAEIPARRTPRLTIEKVRPPAEPADEDTKANLPLFYSAPAVAPEETGKELEPVRLSALTVPANRETGLVPIKKSRGELDTLPDAYQQLELLTQKRPKNRARFVMILPFAALLGCAVGYVAYLQVPSPVISLEVKAKSRTLVVTWPPEATRNALYAAMRVDDASPVLLSPEEKANGRVEVNATKDTKVELIARNWIHDSRGIVRFVQPSMPAP